MCSFVVTVRDVEAPQITCPISFSTQADSFTCMASVSYGLPRLHDNCPNVSLANVLGLLNASNIVLGTKVNVTFTARDDAFNFASCTAVVDTVGNVAPILGTLFECLST